MLNIIKHHKFINMSIIDAKIEVMNKVHGFTTVPTKSMLFKTSSFEPMTMLSKKLKKFIDSINITTIIGSVNISGMLFRTENDSNLLSTYAYKLAKKHSLQVENLNSSGSKVYLTPEQIELALTTGETPVMSAKEWRKGLESIDAKTDAFIIGKLTGLPKECSELLTSENDTISFELNQLLLQKCNNLVTLNSETKLPNKVIGTFNLYIKCTTLKDGTPLKYLKVSNELEK